MVFRVVYGLVWVELGLWRVAGRGETWRSNLEPGSVWVEATRRPAPFGGESFRGGPGPWR